MAKKSQKSGLFPIDLGEKWNFLKIIFQKALDFWKVWAHTMQAFKLRTKQKKLSTPEIPRFTDNSDKSATLWIKAAHQRFLMQIKNLFKKGCADSWIWKYPNFD